MIRRYQFVTHKNTQFKLASVFILWFVVFLASFAFIYFLHFSLLIERTDMMSIHDQLLAKTLLVDQALQLGLWFGIALVGFVFLVWCYLVVYSHRLTGPVHKLENLLKSSVEEGKVPDFELTFRKHDAFHGLAKEFNQFIQMVSEHSKSKTG